MNTLNIISIIAGATGFLAVITAYFSGISKWLKTACHHNPLPSTPSDKKPFVSLIVYSFPEKEDIDTYIRSVTSQDYEYYEIIIVCDTTPDIVEMLKEKYLAEFRNLYFTFLPPGSHNLSRRKMAYTLGLKAAKGEVVITTTANCQVPSSQWLTQLCSAFSNRKTDIVLGYSTLSFNSIKGLGKWYREFDFVMDSSKWISSALEGFAYRGDYHNLAYRRQLYFDKRGYSNSITLTNGDDDIFINAIATNDNTEVVLSESSILIQQSPVSASKSWRSSKSAYLFTSEYLPKRPSFIAGIFSLSEWIASLGLICALILGSSLTYVWIPATIILLIFWGVEIWAYRKLAHRLLATKLLISVIPFLLLRPIFNFFFRIISRSEKKANFTWDYIS